MHEDDVRRFLDLISGDSPKSRYPFATQEHRDLFRHTLWMVPGAAPWRRLRPRKVRTTGKINPLMGRH